MIIADQHLHTAFSEDSDTPMEKQIEAGINKGLKTMCFTEHMDKDFPKDNNGKTMFEVDTEAYYNGVLECREKYKDKMEINFGIEYGFMDHLLEHNHSYVNSYPFDFVIGSIHVVDGYDVYYPDFYQGKTEKEAYLCYFEKVLESVKSFDDFDVCGHIDYIVRYGPNKNRDYHYRDYGDVLDEILKTLIYKGKGIEINTGGFRKLVNEPNPSGEILKRYRELNGEIITIGSDAHEPKDVASYFEKTAELMEKLGFRYYSIFRNRRPEFIKI